MNEMNIESAQYVADTLTGNAQAMIQIIVDSITISVPLDPANTTYAEIMRQVEAGELTIDPADEPE